MRGTTIGSMALLLAAALAPGAGRGAAQQAQPTPGRRVRLRAPAAQVYLVDGVLGVITPDSVVVLVARDRPGLPPAATDTLRVAVARVQVQTLEISRGQVSRRGAGAIVGAVGGAIIGGIIGSASYRDPCVNQTGFEGAMCGGLRDLSGDTQGMVTAGGALVGALGGGLAGLLIGSGLSGERWERVPLAPQSRLQATVGALPGRRAAVGASLAF